MLVVFGRWKLAYFNLMPRAAQVMRYSTHIDASVLVIFLAETFIDIINADHNADHSPLLNSRECYESVFSTVPAPNGPCFN